MIIDLQIQHSRIDLIEGVPLVSTLGDLGFHHFSALHRGQNTFEAQVWRLAHALFDEPASPRLVRDDLATDDLARKTAVSKWLESAVAASVDRESNAALSGPAKVFALLCGHRVEEATEVALESGDMRLALLTAQAGSSEDCKRQTAAQLDLWVKEKTDKHILDDYLSVYGVLAGRIDVVERSSGSLSVARDLDWLRSFGLHLWYGSEFGATVQDVVYTFENHLESDFPPSQPLVQTRNGEKVHDALYKLFQLFAHPETLANSLLDPRSYSQGLSNVRVQWHLYNTLTAVLGLGVSDDGRVTDDAFGKVTVDYADQLESMGLWVEAVFILLHLREQHA